MSRDDRVGAVILGVVGVSLLVVCVRRGGGFDGAGSLVTAGAVLAGVVVVGVVLVAAGRWAGAARSGVRVSGHGHGRDRALIARHEAGHAVAARALGGRVTRAWMSDDGGQVSAFLPRGGSQAAVTFLMAGEIAGRSSRGSSDDRAAIRRELRGLRGSERTRITRAARRDATRIVRRHASEIRSTAEQLDRTGRL